MLDLDRLEQAVRNDEPVDTPKSLFLVLVAELRAARQAYSELHDLYSDLDAHDLTAVAAHRLLNILMAWDKETPDGNR